MGCMVSGVHPASMVPGVYPASMVSGVRPASLVPGVRPASMALGRQDWMRNTPRYLPTLGTIGYLLDTRHTQESIKIALT